MANNIINSQALITQMKEEVLQDMQLAAEPLVEDAVKKFKESVRKRIAAYALTCVEQSFRVDISEKQTTIVIQNRD